MFYIGYSQKIMGCLCSDSYLRKYLRRLLKNKEEKYTKKTGGKKQPSSLLQSVARLWLPDRKLGKPYGVLENFHKHA